MRKVHIPLLGRIIIAIILGVICGNIFNEPLVKIFITFNSLFSQFLGFMIPLIIVGLVTPAIADIGKGAGRMLGITVGLAYLDTVVAGLLAYGVGSWCSPPWWPTCHTSVPLRKRQRSRPTSPSPSHR